MVIIACDRCLEVTDNDDNLERVELKQSPTSNFTWRLCNRCALELIAWIGRPKEVLITALTRT